MKSIALALCATLLLAPAIDTVLAGPPKPPVKPTSDIEQASGASSADAHCMTAHDIGRLMLTVNNYGFLGADSQAISATRDCMTGQLITGCQYPKGARTNYLYHAAFWVGAVVNNDTLVSTGVAASIYSLAREFHPVRSPFGIIIRRSTLDPETMSEAVSEEDIIAVYSDTVTSGIAEMWPDELDGRPHCPLGVEITQKSYAWSYEYAEDFVLFDYTVRNIGESELRDLYLAVYVDPDIWYGPPELGCGGLHHDDLSGFLRTAPVFYGGCEWLDTINMAWSADNDGELDPAFDCGFVPHAIGIKLIRTPADSLEMSFNWFAYSFNPQNDWGPQHRDQVRDMGYGALGTPSGDRNLYYLMRNGEFDYDPVFTAAQPADQDEWIEPNPDLARAYTVGFDTRYVLSFGPFSVSPGQALPVSFALVAGENFHTRTDNFNANMVQKYDPWAYYRGLNFEDLARNSSWASWIYDNPGVDTDSDGYAGEYRLCCQDSAITAIDSTVTPPDTAWEYGRCDKVWYKGDGVPDWRGAAPPPAPRIWVEQSHGSMRIRFNGTFSETTRDVFTHLIDFEGYRVYYARDSRLSSFTLLESYDIANYDKLIYDMKTRQWRLASAPMTLQQIRCEYATSCDDQYFDPLVFTASHPYRKPEFTDSIIAFDAHDFNRSELGVTTDIRRVYPDEPPPHTLFLDSAYDEELTDDGLFKYYEYEYTIDNLLPSVPYYFNVTAFDFGSPESGVVPLESSRTVGAIQTYALPGGEDVIRDDLKVYVYPNPYCADGNYYEQGYEGRDAPWPIRDRIRRIHFANLPPVCTIRIFSLDGDLVRELEHNFAPDDPMAAHHTWDLITRNQQSIVPGLYYWTVEDESGEAQIGKLVVIK